MVSVVGGVWKQKLVETNHSRPETESWADSFLQSEKQILICLHLNVVLSQSVSHSGHNSLVDSVVDQQLCEHGS